MAFMNYDQYIQTFGEQLAKASQPTPIIPQSEGAFAPMESGNQAPPPASPPPAAPAAGAFGGAPVAAAGPEVPAAPAGPMSQAMPPSGPMSQPPGAAPSGAFTPAKSEEGSTGLNMKEVFDDSGEDDREALAKEMEPQVGGNLVAAAEAAEEIDPTLAEKWGVGKWTRHEAAAFLMEFGLRMMQASGSGEGNFFSDVGGSALGATEARRAFKTEEEEKGFKREDREWESKKRERDEKKWGAEDREETRERKRRAADEMRRQEAHETGQQTAEKNLKKGDWTKTIAENGEVVFQDPNTKQEWRTGTAADKNERTGGRGPSVFEENWSMYRAAYAPEGWDSLTPTEQARVKREFMSWMKTGSGQTDRSSHILQAARAMGDDNRWMRANGNPSLEERMRMSEENDRERNPHLYRSREGSGGFVPDWSPEAN